MGICGHKDLRDSTLEDEPLDNGARNRSSNEELKQNNFATYFIVLTNIFYCPFGH